MRTARPSSRTPLMIVISLPSFAPLFSTVAQQNPALSKKELKLLLKSAKTPSDHRRIATYYRQEGQRLTDRSKRDAEPAATYEKDPPSPTLAACRGIGFSQGVTHYRRFARLYRDQAERAMQLAALQEEMAEKAEAALPF